MLIEQGLELLRIDMRRWRQIDGQIDAVTGGHQPGPEHHHLVAKAIRIAHRSVTRADLDRPLHALRGRFAGPAMRGRTKYDVRNGRPDQLRAGGVNRDRIMARVTAGREHRQERQRGKGPEPLWQVVLHGPTGPKTLSLSTGTEPYWLRAASACSCVMPDGSSIL